MSGSLYVLEYKQNHQRISWVSVILFLSKSLNNRINFSLAQNMSSNIIVINLHKNQFIYIENSNYSRLICTNHKTCKFIHCICILYIYIYMPFEGEVSISLCICLPLIKYQICCFSLDADISRKIKNILHVKLC